MDIPRIWRLRNSRYKLQGSICKSCSRLSFPEEIICQSCRSREIEPYRFHGKGTVYSYSVVYSPLSQFSDFVPYIVALITLEEGPMITAQITDTLPNDIYIGMEVEMIIRKISEQGNNGVIIYGYKFRPPIIME